MDSLLNNATEILLLIFLVITFLQSGLDKIFDWNGNISWLKEHFSATFLKGVVPLLVATILILEILVAIICLLGIYNILAMGKITYAFYGAILSCITLLLLLFGQRIAKDYDGARTIVIYLVPAIFLVFLLQL
ncbi:putative membrane protein YphA (DoxX/SURF4 family) [Saonia flava]|uniref:Putative membrane protein YphA (DoxX/SURF4 family) n=1 Tax=Saonia flava TaxID=523696 RepID=A0A846QXY1_9FLAO|nr:DoxX family protein [Saonia flava]NJB71482.1 putative membrane protein YphA (DoxX/SURF4 family) [Saonia flava]